MRLVLRIGGSVVASPLNPALISEYVELLRSLKDEGHQMVVVVGGGAYAREFINVCKSLGLEERAQDEIAISVSRIVAQLFSMKLGRQSCTIIPTTVIDAAKALRDGKIVVMGGLKPGMTTDTVAALVAEKTSADLLVKGTDQNGVYDRDPRSHPDAVKLERLSFEDLSETLSENRHRAGIHQIIDPEAVKTLMRIRLKVAVVNGFDTRNILAAVRGQSVGTVIE